MPMDRMALVTEALADLGSIVRKVQAQTLDQDTFITLTNKMRRDLKALRIDLAKDEVLDSQSLTELGATIGQMLDSGELMTGTALIEGLPNRCRTYGRLAVIDGGHSLNISKPTGA